LGAISPDRVIVALDCSRKVYLHSRPPNFRITQPSKSLICFVTARTPIASAAVHDPPRRSLDLLVLPSLQRPIGRLAGIGLRDASSVLSTFILSLIPGIVALRCRRGLRSLARSLSYQTG